MVYAVIFVLWGLYRLLFRFPVLVEELVFKPLVFLPPVMSVLAGEDGRSGLTPGKLGFRREGLFLSIYYGLTLGVVYILAVRLGRVIFSGKSLFYAPSISHGSFFNLFLLSFFTAFWEQIVFSGFMLGRLVAVFQDEWSSAGLTALLFTGLHLPILLVDSGSGPLFVVVQLLLFFLVGFGNAVLMLRTENILAPVLSHTFWAVAVGLFSGII